MCSLCTAGRYHNPQPERAVKPKNLRGESPVKLKNLSPEPSGHRPVKLQNPLQKGRGKPCPFCSLKAVMVE